MIIIRNKNDHKLKNGRNHILKNGVTKEKELKKCFLYFIEKNKKHFLSADAKYILKKDGLVHKVLAIAGAGKGQMYVALPLKVASMFQTHDLQFTMEQPYCCTKAHL